MDERIYRAAARALQRLREEHRAHLQAVEVHPSPSVTYGEGNFEENAPMDDRIPDEGGGRSMVDGTRGDVRDASRHRRDSYYHLPGHPGIDCLDVIEALGLGFHLGNVLKYIWRAGRKTSDLLQDLKKAREYIDRKIECLEKERQSGGY